MNQGPSFIVYYIFAINKQQDLMITIISGTNRRNSRTFPIAQQYYELFKEQTVEHIELLNLAKLPLEFIHAGMYQPGGQNKDLKKLQDTFMIPANKFFFVIPEYNGSYPGILKLFIDACSIREYKPTFNNKKSAISGIATGRSGNIRGIDHLRGSLTHMGSVVMPAILPISSVDDLTNEEGRITDKASKKSMLKFVQEFLKF